MTTVEEANMEVTRTGNGLDAARERQKMLRTLTKSADEDEGKWNTLHEMAIDKRGVALRAEASAALA